MAHCMILYRNKMFIGDEFFHCLAYNFHRVLCGAQRIFNGLCLFRTSILGVPRKIRYSLELAEIWTLYHWVLDFSLFRTRLASTRSLNTSLEVEHRFDQISKVQIHYANTEMHTQEIRIDRVFLMNFYTNEDLSRHCLKCSTQKLIS